MLEELGGAAERGDQVGAMPFGSEGEHIADDPEGVPPSLRGWDHVLDPIGKEERADPIMFLRGGEGQHRSDFHRAIGLGDGVADERGTRIGRRSGKA
jgi:hypothetical protein